MRRRSRAWLLRLRVGSVFPRRGSPAGWHIFALLVFCPSDPVPERRKREVNNGQFLTPEGGRTGRLAEQAPRGNFPELDPVLAECRQHAPIRAEDESEHVAR